MLPLNSPCLTSRSSLSYKMCRLPETLYTLHPHCMSLPLNSIHFDDIVIVGCLQLSFHHLYERKRNSVPKYLTLFFHVSKLHSILLVKLLETRF